MPVRKLYPWKENSPKEITARAVRKPNSVSGLGYPKPSDDHSSLNAGCPAFLATYPGAWAGHPQALPYLVLHRVGFTKLLRSPGELVRSYRTVSPLPAPIQWARGGILSVALSFALPRLHVMEHPALWCSDFPPDLATNHIPRSGDRLDCAGRNRCSLLLVDIFPINYSLAVRTKP